jgi:hypothetical protein
MNPRHLTFWPGSRDPGHPDVVALPSAHNLSLPRACEGVRMSTEQLTVFGRQTGIFTEDLAPSIARGAHRYGLPAHRRRGR